MKSQYNSNIGNYSEIQGDNYNAFNQSLNPTPQMLEKLRANEYNKFDGVDNSSLYTGNYSMGFMAGNRSLAGQ